MRSPREARLLCWGNNLIQTSIQHSERGGVRSALRGPVWPSGFSHAFECTRGSHVEAKALCKRPTDITSTDETKMQVHGLGRDPQHSRRVVVAAGLHRNGDDGRVPGRVLLADISEKLRDRVKIRLRGGVHSRQRSQFVLVSDTRAMRAQSSRTPVGVTVSDLTQHFPVGAHSHVRSDVSLGFVVVAERERHAEEGSALQLIERESVACAPLLTAGGGTGYCDEVFHRCA